jgi:serine/threonine protein phosphatase 1
MANRSENSKNALIRHIQRRPDRLFAIGDIHGHSAELGALLKFLVEEKGLSENDQLIFIGDYVDRGRDSKGVIEQLLSFRERWPETVFLKGNHEEMLLSFLGLGGPNGEYYIKNGGITFFNSYGIELGGSLEDLRQAIPRHHLELLKGLELGVSLAEFIFVHAGLSPLRSLDNQSASDLLWIREDFLNYTHNFEKIVVFGHTAFNQVVLNLPYKIGIDTGAGYGNILSAVELVQGELYQVNVGSKEVLASQLSDLLPEGTK